MLTQLSIRNYALIDELDVTFCDGFNIITGETGAGKSILLGGLSLVLGKRADLSQIKDPSVKCVVEGTFEINGYHLESLFKIHDLDFDNHTIIRRELLSSGKSRAFINDTPVKLDVLNKVALHLIDIHSQNETLSLTNITFLFSIVDAIAGNQTLLAEYQTLFDKFKYYKRELLELKDKQLVARKDQDYSAFLLGELEEVNLSSEYYKELEDLEKQLANLELIQEKLSLSSAVLDNETTGVLDQLKEIKRQLSQINGFNKDYELAYDRIVSTIIELEDLTQDLSSLNEDLVADPETLNTVNQNLNKINDLLAKHGVQTVESLQEIKAALLLKTSENKGIDDKIEQAEKEIEFLGKKLASISNELSKNRLKSFPILKKSLESNLIDLGMPNAKFKIELEELNQFNIHGRDELIFQFTANKGGQFKELKDSASGGELSRIMLSLKSLLASHVKLPTIIFDEIDTGVSGIVADKMGDIMRSLSQNLQVISITHLPQIAAKGNSHYKVFKKDESEITLTKIRKLNSEERIVEIAEMLGGLKLTDSAMAHAKQLLN